VTESTLGEEIELLRWDSEHFRFPVARVCTPLEPTRMSTAVDVAESQGVRCLTALVKTDRVDVITMAEDLGFRCYDVRIDLDRQMDRAHGVSAGKGLRLATESDLLQLEPIARERFSATRFVSDPHFPSELARDLYVEWLRRGHREEDRRLVTVSGLEGFVVCHLDHNNGVGAIELIAVSAKAEGTGLATRLLHGAESLFMDAGLVRAHVVTQGRNLPAQRLYQRHGYRTGDVSLWLHRWAPSR
jgi:ribosomal protein S18 acetylase RimI-like enzyme